MPSLQSSSDFGTPDPEVFFDDLCHETCDLDPDPEFFFGDLCFEAPSDLDATSDALDALDALQHTDPALKKLLAVAARVKRRKFRHKKWLDKISGTPQNNTVPMASIRNSTTAIGNTKNVNNLN